MIIEFKPTDNNVLIEPLEYIQVEKEVTEREEINALYGSNKPNYKLVTSVKNVLSKYQLGKVIAVCHNDHPNLCGPQLYNIGDIIVYDINAGLEFDLIPNTRLMKLFDIKGHAKILNDNLKIVHKKRNLSEEGIVEDNDTV